MGRRFEQRQGEPLDLFLLRIFAGVIDEIPEPDLSVAVDWIVAKSRVKVIDALRQNANELREIQAQENMVPLESALAAREVGRG